MMFTRKFPVALAALFALLALAVAMTSAAATSHDSLSSADLPTAYFHPNVLYFKVGTSSSATTTLTNSSTETLKISSLALTGIRQSSCFFTSNCPFSPSGLAGGKGCQVTLSCNPSTAGLMGDLVDYDNSAAGQHSVKLEAKN